MIYGYRDVSFLLLCFFSRIVIVGFLLGPWPIEFQVFNYFSSVRYGAYLIKCTLDPIKSSWLLL